MYISQLVSPHHHGSVKAEVKVGISLANCNDIFVLLVCLPDDRVTYLCPAAGGGEDRLLVLGMKKSYECTGIVNRIWLSIIKVVDWEGNSFSLNM
jgi:hypothetical protein